MKTNNLISNIMIQRGQVQLPSVGDGATVCGYSDRTAGTIISVSQYRGKTYITWQRDIATRTDNHGMSDMQEYQYQRDPNGRKYTFRLENNGCWTRVVKNPETGRWNKEGYPSISIGHRSEYYDFSF